MSGCCACNSQCCPNCNPNLWDNMITGILHKCSKCNFYYATESNHICVYPVETRESKWQLIESMPRNEEKPFLVLMDSGEKDLVVMQVSMFEGNLYPDHLGAAIDYHDIVTTAKYWMPLNALPTAPKQGD